uniref:Uncharacterized protein n=2 Tax=Rhabditophanes sp. KR3021 TaxID=114890 RepID=A0AC35U0G9_9BILA
MKKLLMPKKFGLVYQLVGSSTAEAVSVNGNILETEEDRVLAAIENANIAALGEIGMPTNRYMQLRMKSSIILLALLALIFLSTQTDAWGGWGWRRRMWGGYPYGGGGYGMGGYGMGGYGMGGYGMGMWG